jgi:hypothetical protein
MPPNGYYVTFAISLEIPPTHFTKRHSTTPYDALYRHRFHASATAYRLYRLYAHAVTLKIEQRGESFGKRWWKAAIGCCEFME